MQTVSTYGEGFLICREADRPVTFNITGEEFVFPTVRVVARLFPSGRAETVNVFQARAEGARSKP